jgi:hypothetical protein
LEGPYKVIASDINNDGQVKASDLLTLRKVILGVINQFPNNQESWRFIPKGATFTDVNDPFPFAEEINIGQLNSSIFGKDMTAVKIGDVNGSAITNLSSSESAVSRSALNMSFEIEDAEVNGGDRIYVPVYAKGIESLIGYQFTLNITGSEFVGVESDQLDISSEHIGLLDEFVTMSWSTVEGVSINNETPLFTLILDVTEDTRLGNILSINSDMTIAEAYDTELRTYNVDMNTRSSLVDDNKFAVFQNRPNPFMESTNISFYLPEAMDVELTITDVTGRQVSKSVKAYNAGKQSVEIKYSDLGISGILYYTIKAGGYTATKKMVNVR